MAKQNFWVVAGNEPSIADLLSDPITLALMRADHVLAADVLAIFRRLERSSTGAATGWAARPELRRLVRAAEATVAAAALVALLPMFVLMAILIRTPGEPLLVRRPAPRAGAWSPAPLAFNYRDRRGETATWWAFRQGQLAHFLAHTCRGDQLPRLVDALRGTIGLFPGGGRPSLFD